MSAKGHVILKINLVLVGLRLLDTRQETFTFSRAAASEVMETAPRVAGGPSTYSRRLELQMERIAIDLLPDYTTIECEYPARGNLDRLAEIIGLAVYHTDRKGVEPTALSYNIDLYYDQYSGQPALHYLGSRLFNKKDLDIPETELIGGSGRLVFKSATEQWTFSIEPRFNDSETSRVFLNVNLHKVENRLPESTEIKKSFEEIWEQALEFSQRLDQGISQ